MPLGDSGPVVSFAFDDFPRSAYTVAGSILKDAGARGTYYVAPGLLNACNSVGEYCTLDDLYSLVADGHELATHTFHHVSCHGTPASTYLQEVRRGRDAMREHAELKVSDNFAFPFGAVSPASKRMVGREMLSCRGNFHGINGPEVDLNLLRANALYGDMTGLPMVRSLISANERTRGWLIFYTHDLGTNPSPHGCTPDFFQSVVKLVCDKAMKILTVDEVIANCMGAREAVVTAKMTPESVA